MEGHVETSLECSCFVDRQERPTPRTVAPLNHAPLMIISKPVGLGSRSSVQSETRPADHSTTMPKRCQITSRSAFGPDEDLWPLAQRLWGSIDKLEGALPDDVDT